LARTHALSVAGDTLFTAAMAGTVFFSVADFDAARGRVAMLLVLTIAPFAVAAPLLGPLFDRVRGGRRWMVVGLAVARALLSLLIIRHRDSWLFFIEALLFLVLSKGYLIARGALVPTTVRNDAELVKANSRLALLSGVTAALTAGPAVLLLWLGGASWVLALAAMVFVGCAVAAYQLPSVKVAAEPPDAVERAELRSIGILVAAYSMGAIRLVVGFLVFQVGFYAKDNNQGLLIVAAAVGAQLGFLGGSLASPGMRRRFSEERILAIVLSFTVAAGLLATLVGLLADGSAVTLGFAATLLSAAVAATSNVGKQAFDAIVQRDAPDANRGRSFARFETRFQLVWVVGALIPTAQVLPLEVSFVLVSVVAAFALFSYLVGRRRAALGVDYRLVRFPSPSDRWRVTSMSAARATLGYVRPARRQGGHTPAEPAVVTGASGEPAGGAGAPSHDEPAAPGDVQPAAATGISGLPDLPALPPRARTPADGGVLGLDDDPRRYVVHPGVDSDADTDATRDTIFGDGAAPHESSPRSLDPRRVLDPRVPMEESGVPMRRYLGFLGDTLSDGDVVAGASDGGGHGDGDVVNGGTGADDRRRRGRRTARRQRKASKRAQRKGGSQRGDRRRGDDPLPGMDV
jgi:MFS family permease